MTNTPYKFSEPPTCNRCDERATVAFRPTLRFRSTRFACAVHADAIGEKLPQMFKYVRFTLIVNTKRTLNEIKRDFLTSAVR